MASAEAEEAHKLACAMRSCGAFICTAWVHAVAVMAASTAEVAAAAANQCFAPHVCSTNTSCLSVCGGADYIDVGREGELVKAHMVKECSVKAT